VEKDTGEGFNTDTNKLAFLLALAVILLDSPACGVTGTSTVELAESHPALLDISMPSITLAVTSTQIPAETIPPSPTSTGSVEIPDIGDGCFQLTNPPLDDERIGQMKFRLMELGYLYGPDRCTITGSVYTYVFVLFRSLVGDLQCLVQHPKSLFQLFFINNQWRNDQHRMPVGV